MSVDPLQKEYPSLSVYQFCANSPIIYKDLDGRRIFIYYEDSEGNPQLWEYKPNLTPPDNEFVKSAVEALNYVYNNSKYGSKIIDQAVATPQSVDIYEEKGADVVFKGYDEEANDNEHIICESEFNRIKWNPTLGLETVPNSDLACKGLYIENFRISGNIVKAAVPAMICPKKVGQKIFGVQFTIAVFIVCTWHLGSVLLFLACKGAYIEIFRISGNIVKAAVHPAIAVFTVCTWHLGSVLLFFHIFTL